MAKPRKKKRTQPVPGIAAGKSGSSNRDGRMPKSMVIRIGAGEVGPSVSQLVTDVRRMMEPGTASRLRERKANKLRDFTTMAGPLGVTHLLLFSRSASGNTNLRIALTPRGPTLHFHVERYALCKDVRKAQRHPRDGQKDYKTAPLLVMNNFLTAEEGGDEDKSAAETDGAAKQASSKTPKHLESLTTTVFQSLFPAIAPQSTPLSSIRRVLLLDREVPSNSNSASNEAPPPSSTTTTTSSSSSSSLSPGYTLNLRHYAITTRPTGVSRGVRKLRAAESVSTNKRHALPDLGNLRDVSDYLLDPAASTTGFTSGSESEAETDAEVEVLAAQATKVLPRRKLQRDEALAKNKTSNSNVPVEKRAVKLAELGPRMRLRLVKVEEGVCEGRTMWHDFITKTRAEEKALDAKWTERKRVKEERRRVQRENVERKKAEKKAAKGKDGDEDGDEEMDEDDEEEEMDSEADYEDVEDDDDVWASDVAADDE